MSNKSGKQAGKGSDAFVTPPSQKRAKVDLLATSDGHASSTSSAPIHPSSTPPVLQSSSTLSCTPSAAAAPTTPSNDTGNDAIPDLKLLTLNDITLRDTRNRFMKPSIPYRVHIRVIEVSMTNPTSNTLPTNQKMTIAGVQSDGSVLIVEQWTSAEFFDQCVSIRGQPDNKPSDRDRSTLSDNLNFLSELDADGDAVLLCILIGNKPVKHARKDPPVAVVQAVNVYDESFYMDALCKIKLPSAIRFIVTRLPLTPTAVIKYVGRFHVGDPTTWQPTNAVQLDVADVLLTEENFFD